MGGSVLLMLGNWSQHIFVSQAVGTMDMKRSRCNYHLTYNVIDAPFNQKTFNDGYHIEHHIHSRRHWSVMPQHSVDAATEYFHEDAIVFKGLDFIMVALMVFFRRYKSLAAAFVDIKVPKRTDAEIEDLLRSRLAPVKRK